MVKYTSLDVGELYNLMFTVSDEELKKIEEAGLQLGHAGVVDRAYEVMNTRDLTRKGATEDDIIALERAGIYGNDVEIDQICSIYGLTPKRPKQDELSEGLQNAVGLRGYSIDDEGTAVGSFYQRLFGEDFLRMVFMIPTQMGVIEMSYLELPPQIRRQVNTQILAQKGF